MKRLASLAAAAVLALMPNLRTTRGQAPKPPKKTRADFDRLAAAHAKRERKAAQRRAG